MKKEKITIKVPQGLTYTKGNKEQGLLPTPIKDVIRRCLEAGIPDTRFEVVIEEVPLMLGDLKIGECFKWNYNDEQMNARYIKTQKTEGDRCVVLGSSGFLGSHLRTKKVELVAKEEFIK